MNRSAAHIRDTILVPITAALTLGGGVVNLVSLLNRHWGERPLLRELFPLEFVHLSRLVVLLFGFALVITSINIFRRKKRALATAMVLAVLSAVVHMMHRRDMEQVVYSLVILAALFITRRSFTVRSGLPRPGTAALSVAVAVIVALAYGVAGFWFLDARDFGVNFTFPDALRGTVRFMLLLQDSEYDPLTRHARWFLTSLDLMTTTMIVYALFTVFRPVVFRFGTHPREMRRAAQIIREHGRSVLDHFKVWPDKSFFFAESGRSFLAYSVGGRYAIVLGDPVGPAAEIEPCLREFLAFCHDNDWSPAFHQAAADHLAAYLACGLRKLKIGEDAITDLSRLTLDGKEMKRIRNTLHKLEGQGVRTVRHEPPVPDEVIAEARSVSDEWLRMPGRRERTFTLGQFETTYVRSTPLVAAVDAGGRMLAFVNMIPSYCPGEATIDLMRHRHEVPNGLMEFLFVKLFEECRRRGFERFNLGMAPMSGFQEREEASPEERALHLFFQRLNALFSFRGLRQFKAKFATSWEPRYLIYPNVLALPAVALALARVSELRRRRIFPEVGE